MRLTLSLLAAVLCCGLFTGCKTAPGLGPASVQIAVQAGTMYAVQAKPDAVPYLQAAAPIVCNLAGSGTLNPQAVVDALQNSSVDALKTPEAVIIMNSALTLYGAIYESYGANVQASVLQPYLLAVCHGMTAGLPVKFSKSSVSTAPVVSLPHIR